eukprot:TRINITY_DN3211_c0_g2_i1.p1 TRINITY_DN3211_c0_g2~~TRINITY_DN3211_c0_g2_i1.p1  ORF type:complete len:928 (+),score=457.38 TRINITY_DN3211_c0_g2_i1:106-2784(+)
MDPRKPKKVVLSDDEEEDAPLTSLADPTAVTESPSSKAMPASSKATPTPAAAPAHAPAPAPAPAGDRMDTEDADSKAMEAGPPEATPVVKPEARAENAKVAVAVKKEVEKAKAGGALKKGAEKGVEKGVEKRVKKEVESMEVEVAAPSAGLRDEIFGSDDEGSGMQNGMEEEAEEDKEDADYEEEEEAADEEEGGDGDDEDYVEEAVAVGKKRKAPEADGSAKRRKTGEATEIKVEKASGGEGSAKGTKAAKAKGDKKVKKEGKSKKSKKSGVDEKKPKAKAKSKAKAKGGKAVKEEGVKETVEERRERKRQEKLAAEMPDEKWWEDGVPGKDQPKWKTLEHNGPVFPPAYEPHGVKMLYDGEPVELTPEQEEVATFYATYLATDHAKNSIFNKNFFDAFKKILNKGRKRGDPHPIRQFSKCDFTPIHEHVMAVREARKARSKEEKEVEKKQNLAIKEKYGFALLDGRREQVGNFRVEPPGLFLGRGKHPKAGMLKARVMPEDVTINISEGARVPECPMAGHAWKEVVHNPDVGWLAFWQESINGSLKYVYFSANSKLRGLSDLSKFEVARKLSKKLDTVRKKYTKEIKSSKPEVMQRGVALYLIDRLALRVGNEKGSEEADTVGCCSLRIEHVSLEEPSTVSFDFLGKDSVPYKNDVEVPAEVFAAFKKLLKKKKPTEQLFPDLSPPQLNSHLKSIMPELTAKVFRTCNASMTLEQELAKMEPELLEATDDEKLLFYNRCNREVAMLCNHQRTLPKTFPEQMKRLNDKIADVKKDKAALQKHMKKLRKGEEGYTPPAGMPKSVESAKKKIAQADARLEKLKIRLIEKEENKSFSMTTSKTNYLDPRITVAWCKKVNLPIEKIFAKTLRLKFPWAMSVEEFSFTAPKKEKKT